MPSIERQMIVVTVFLLEKTLRMTAMTLNMKNPNGTVVELNGTGTTVFKHDVMSNARRKT
jgi:hypothetical protein